MNVCVCVRVRKNAHEFWTGPKAGWNWLYPLTAQEGFFFFFSSLSFHMQKGMERRYFLYNPHVTIEIARIRSNQSEILEWNEERSRYSAKTKHSRKGGKKESSWKVIQHRALHSVDPQCWDLCCRKCKNLENAVVMVVPISRAETLAACAAALVAIQICGVFTKGKNFTWDFSYSKTRWCKCGL